MQDAPRLSGTDDSIMKKTIKMFLQAPLASQFGFVVICVYIFVAIFAPVIAPYGEREVVGDHYEPWSNAFLLGTDAIGRDMFSRMVFACRNTIGIAFIATLDQQIAVAHLELAVEQFSIPVLPECQEICRALSLDPLGLLA